MGTRQDLRRCSRAKNWCTKALSDYARVAQHRAWLNIAGAAFAFATTSQGLAAQQPEFQCATLQPSASKAPPYSRVPGKQRCEGYFEQTVAQPFIELLSLTRDRPDALHGGAARVLYIRAHSGQSWHLTIQPLHPSPFYRVDSRLVAGRPLEWNPKQMLASTGLHMADLGFLARTISTDPDTPLVTPVSLFAADAALAYAVLRVSVPVASIAVRQYIPGAGAGAGAGTGAAAASWRELPGTPLYAWDTIALPIVLGGDVRDARVDVRAIDSEGRLLPMLQFIVASH